MATEIVDKDLHDWRLHTELVTVLEWQCSKCKQITYTFKHANDKPEQVNEEDTCRNYIIKSVLL